MTAIPFIIVVAGLILWRRLSATRKPIKGNGIRILLPILFVVVGISSFIKSGAQIHLNPLEVCVSLLLGIVLSIPLIVTTRYEIRTDGFIYAKKSVAFVISLLVVLGIRIGLRNTLHGYDSSTMLVMYFLVAIGYVVPWRVASFIKFRKVYQTKSVENTPA